MHEPTLTFNKPCPQSQSHEELVLVEDREVYSQALVAKDQELVAREEELVARAEELEAARQQISQLEVCILNMPCY